MKQEVKTGGAGSSSQKTASNACTRISGKSVALGHIIFVSRD